MSEAAVRYVRNAPASTAPAPERLEFALRYLDDPDPVITNDAFTEFAAAKYDDVKLVAAGVTPQRVRAWLADPKCDPLRIGFFGMLLGIVGSKDDAAYLEAKILEPAEDTRLGADGLMSGYLLLTRGAGLDLIDRTKLRDPEAAYFDKLSAMNALRFLWTYAPECIPKDRLRASMRLMLDYPPLSDLAIIDLARWQDWSATDRLIAMYADPAYGEPTVRQSIIRYLLVAQRVKPSTGGEDPPGHALKASRFIDRLRTDDPDAVRAAEQRLFVQ
jgi:hypothetical protein